jgi:Domain of unknown function (DUF5047)
VYQVTNPAAWGTALGTSHRITVGAAVQTFAGTNLLTPRIVSGTVVADANSAIRRSCDVLLELTDAAGNSIVPVDSTSSLTPFGNELVLSRGIISSDGAYVQSVPLGVFHMTRVEIDDTGSDCLIRVQGYDRARKVGREKLTDPYPIASSTNLGSVIQTLLSQQVPGLTYNLTPTTYAVPAQTLPEETDPWAFCWTSARDAGYQLYFDVAGQVVMAPAPASSSVPPVATFSEGAGQGATRYLRVFDQENVDNDFIVISESSSLTTPIQARSQDTDTGSATNVGGAYGDVPVFVRTTTVLTQAQAQSSSDNLLRVAIGSAESVQLEAIPNPALDIYDVVAASRQRINLSGNWIIDSFQMPLDTTSPMTMMVRRVVA